MTPAKIAIRNVFRHKTRSLITISAIAFGCTAITFVGGFFEDILYKMRESYIKAHTGHLQVYRQGFFEKGGGSPAQYRIDHPQELAQLIAQMVGVERVTSRVEFSGLLSTGENTVSCIGQGVEPAYETTVGIGEASHPRQDLVAQSGSVIESGAPLTDADPYGVILGRGLAASLDAHAGDGLILVAHTVDGAINAADITVRGIFFTSSKAFDDRAVRLPLSSAQQLLQTTSVQSLVVMLHQTSQTARIKHDLQRLIAERHLDLEVKTWDELSDFYTKTKALFGRMFFILKLVIAIIVILSIYNTMNMAVLERTTEIGTIMALGTSRRQVWRLFLYEGAALGLSGGLAGIAAGVAVTWCVRRIGIPMPPPPGATMTWFSEPTIVPSVLLFALGLSLVTALLSAFYPAYKASRLEIAQALRHT